jgi:hypothetical protein
MIAESSHIKTISVWWHVRLSFGCWIEDRHRSSILDAYNNWGSYSFIVLSLESMRIVVDESSGSKTL